MPKQLHLTNRQKHFCELYTNPQSETFSNGKKSYEKAGFRTNDPGKQSYMMLRRPEIRSYLEELQEKKLASYNWTKKDYIQEGIDTIRELPRNSPVRSRYYEIVGKVFGFFSDAPVQNVLVYNEENEVKNTLGIQQRLKSLISKTQKSSNPSTSLSP